HLVFVSLRPRHAECRHLRSARTFRAGTTLYARYISLACWRRNADTGTADWYLARLRRRALPHRCPGWLGARPCVVSRLSWSCRLADEKGRTIGPSERGGVKIRWI